MNKPLLIQVAVLLPLVGVASILFALGWWIPAVVASVAAIAASIWVRQAVVDMRVNEAPAASAQDVDADDQSGREGESRLDRKRLFLGGTGHRVDRSVGSP